VGTNVGNITLSASQRAQLLNLQKTARQLDVTSLRLATGQKVSSALDNPSSFFLSRSLRNRADDLTRLLDGIGQNIKVIQEADHGVEADLRLLDLAESYLREVENKYLAGEVGTSTGAPDNETYVTFNSAADFTSYIPGQDIGGTVTVIGNDQVEFANGSPWKRLAFNYTVTPDTVLIFDFRSTLINEVSTIGFDNDQNFGNDNRRFWIYGTQTSGITYAAPFPTYEYTDVGNWETIEIPVGLFFTGNFSNLAFVSDDDAAPFGNSAYRNITLREGPLQAGSQVADGSVFEKEYAKITDQIDMIAEDANYRGINLLKDENMTTFFNPARTNKLVTEGIDATVAGLGLGAATLDTLEGVRAEIEKVQAARKILRNYGVSLSTNLNVIQIRQDFTESVINTNKAGADDLSNADLNEEGANMLALQTLQQLQTTVLAMGQANILSILA
jgi:flagellin